MDLNFSGSQNALDVFNEASELVSRSMRIKHIDSSRPWGGFMVIDDADLEIFLYQFFPQLEKHSLGAEKLSPKILLVAPGKRLSWQYHARRAELWKVIGGSVGVIRSDNDKEGDKTVLLSGDSVELQQGERHRLVGLQDWGIVAEIWKHTDPSNPSNEDDIIRVQDDFGR